jgi:hypothetical protein
MGVEANVNAAAAARAGMPLDVRRMATAIYFAAVPMSWLPVAVVRPVTPLKAVEVPEG